MGLRTVNVLMTGNSQSLQQAMTAASRTASQFDTTMNRLSTRGIAAGTGAGLVLYQVLTRLAKAFQDTVGAAIGLDAAMRNVNSISGLSEGQLRSLSGAVLELSRHIPKSATDLANGLYDIASSGFQGAAGLEVLRASGIAAVAGLTDTATAAQVVAGSLNAYGLSAGSASAVSDTLFQTVNLGVLQFSDLAQGLGQVTGAAAASKVPLEDVGAAIATLTRAGSVPAEAFTSLNQVMAQIIQPGDAMAATLKSLGYQSGASALATKGLHGVIEQLRQSTGGSAEQVTRLFTDVRAARGALLLMTDSGKLYNEVQQGFSDKTELSGRAMATFREQMKSTRSQIQLFENRVGAAAIETATHLLPAINAGLRDLGAFGGELQSVGRDLSPFFDALQSVGVSLGRVLKDLATAAGPLVRVFGALAGTALIATLNTLAGGLASVLDLLTRHKSVVYAVAGVYLLTLVPALAAAARAMAVRIYVAAVMGLVGLIQAAGAAGGAVRGLAAAFTALATAEAAATLGITAAIAGIANAINANHEQARKGKEAAEELAKGFDALDPASRRSQDALERERQQMRSNIETLNHYKGVLGATKIFLQNATPFTDNTGGRAAHNAIDAANAYSKMNAAAAQAQGNVRRLAQETGFTQSQIVSVVRELDLTDKFTQPWDQAGDAIDVVRLRLGDLLKQTGLTGAQLAASVGQDVEAIKAFQQAIDDAASSTAKAFASATDVLAGFQPDKTSAGVQAATKKLTDAETALESLQARQSRAKRPAADADLKLAAARRRVADAQDAVNKAQSQAGKSGDLTGFYRNQIASANAFVRNIETATKRGLDPRVVERLLEAGPEAAAPVLSRLVADHSGHLIKLVNQSEAALSKISERAVELARLTQRAISSSSSKLSSELATAQRIDLERLSEGKNATAESIAKALKLPPDKVVEIAADFGIAIQREVDRRKIHVPYDFVGPTGPDYVRDPRPSSSSHWVARAGGGPVWGAGSSTSDSIPAWLSNGEYVIRAAAVQRFGIPLLDALNAGRLPKFAMGGYVQPRPSSVAGSPAVHVVRVAAPVTHQRTVQVGQVVAHDYDDFRAQMDRDARFAAATGVPL